MGDVVKWLVVSGLGFVLFVAWTQFGDCGPGGPAADTTIPEVIGEGGGPRVEFELITSHAAQLGLDVAYPDADESSFSAVLDLDAGTHTYAFELPSGVGWFLEANLGRPPVGATVAWTVWEDGRVVAEADERLEQELSSNYAFFVQYEREAR